VHKNATDNGTFTDPLQHSESTPCYWINRAQDDLRRDMMMRWLAVAKMRHSRIEALTPNSLPRFKILKHHRNTATIPEIACVASHLKAVQQAYDDGSPYALILEDDVRALYVYDYERIVGLAPDDWETLQLHVSNPPVIDRLGKIYRTLGALWQEWEKDNYSAGAYLINRRGMKKLIDLYCPADGRQDPIDLSMIYAVNWVTSEFMLFKRTASYTITLPLFVHDLTLESSINPGKLPLYEKGLAAIERVSSGVRDDLNAQNAGHDYPFAVGTLDI